MFRVISIYLTKHKEAVLVEDTASWADMFVMLVFVIMPGIKGERAVDRQVSLILHLHYYANCVWYNH
jgi:hypothetical protein